MNESKLFRTSEQGSVLIITIIVLLLLTVLGLGAVALNSTQTRIATNSADAQVSFQTAEGTLRLAESNLVFGIYQHSSFLANTRGLYIQDPTNAPKWNNNTFWSDSNAVLSGFQGQSKIPASFFIEQLPSVVTQGTGFKTSQSVAIYRITAQAVGPSGGSVVRLQSTVKIQ